MAAEHFVRYETDGSVAVITLDRPAGRERPDTWHSQRS